MGYACVYIYKKMNMNVAYCASTLFIFRDFLGNKYDSTPTLRDIFFTITL